jgi:hypothetical protein
MGTTRGQNRLQLPAAARPPCDTCKLSRLARKLYRLHKTLQYEDKYEKKYDDKYEKKYEDKYEKKYEDKYEKKYDDK